MLQDQEIRSVLAQFADNPPLGLDAEYIPPVAVNSGHALQFEGGQHLGAVTVWPSGSFEWSVFLIDSGEQSSIGCDSCHSAIDLSKRLSVILASYAMNSRD